METAKVESVLYFIRTIQIIGNIDNIPQILKFS